MSQDAATRRTRMARPERERQILAVAHTQFATRGFAAVTMDEVAADVGVTKPLLYNYFGNKERLYLACLEQAAGALTETLTAAAAGAESPGDALRDGVRAFFAFVEAHRDGWRLLYDETLPASGEVADRVAAQRERLARLVATLIEQLVDPATPEPGPAAEGLAHALLGAAEALARWWLAGQPLSASATADLLLAAVEPGIREAARAHPQHTKEDRTQ
jgi:AcrR family transcriptional regulator